MQRFGHDGPIKMSESRLLIAELDSTLQRASSSQHLTMLRGVTDLFINSAEMFSDEHVAIFDDVIGRLIDKADRQALAELSNRLAPVDNAPPVLSARAPLAIASVKWVTSSAVAVQASPVALSRRAGTMPTSAASRRVRCRPTADRSTRKAC